MAQLIKRASTGEGAGETNSPDLAMADKGRANIVTGSLQQLKAGFGHCACGDGPMRQTQIRLRRAIRKGFLNTGIKIVICLDQSGKHAQLARCPPLLADQTRFG